MIKYMLVVMLLLLSGSALQAEIKVHAKKASTETKTVSTTTVVDTTQLKTEEGTSLGEATVTERETSVISSVTGKPSVLLFVTTERPIDEVLLKVTSKTCKPVLKEPGVYSVSEPGKHIVVVKALAENPLYWPDDLEVTVDISGIPIPDPKPDDPTPIDPTPSVAPIAGEGLRVMYVYESSERVTAAQEEIMDGAEMRTFLFANCAKGPDGRSSEWRKLDRDTQFTDPTSIWKKALDRPRASIPWMLISNGKTGYEGPLPATVTEAIALVKKFIPLSQAVKTLPRVVMFTMNPCVRCDVFKKQEAPKLVGQVNLEINSTPDNTITQFPTFYVYGAKGTVRLVGGSAETILKLVKELQ